LEGKRAAQRRHESEMQKERRAGWSKKKKNDENKKRRDARGDYTEKQKEAIRVQRKPCEARHKERRRARRQ
jgi:hypothetical protein